MTRPNDPVLLFDGDCLLCNNSVQYILEHDQRNRLKFGRLQAAEARDLLGDRAERAMQNNSVLLYENGKLYDRSTAALRAARHMGGLHKTLANVGLMTPKPLRDAVYDFVAKNRYNWFGKQDEACPLPKPEHRKRVIF